MHDPVTPIIVKPSVLGWKAKKRQVELTIERVFTGEELVLRMKGWVTADVKQVIEIIKPYGYLKVLDEQDLVVEVQSEEDYEKVTRALQEKCGNEVFLERL
jgi:dissimilatory sulfite reductase (desulfoviridin) alpha/beta subunit